MKNKLFASARIALTGLILGTSAGFAATPLTIEVQTAAQVSALNGSGATYGPPSNATFPMGPFTVGSGTSVNLTEWTGCFECRHYPVGAQPQTTAWHLLVLVASA
jgi:hypothetical protein